MRLVVAHGGPHHGDEVARWQSMVCFSLPYAAP